MPKQMNLPDEFPPVFDPALYGLSRRPEEVIPLRLAAALPGDEIFVNDVRTNFSGVPKCQTVEDVATYFGGTVARSELGWLVTPSPVGKRVWRLAGWLVRDAIAAFIAQFINVNGTPAVGVAIVHSWPGAPTLDSNVLVKPNWLDFLGYGRGGVWGLTNGEGNIGFGFTGGMACQPSGGVGVIFPLCPGHTDDPAAADCATKLCWNGSTNHAVADPIFQEVIMPATLPPPSNGADTYVAILEKDGVAVARKVYEPIAAVSGYKEVLYKGTERLGEIEWENR